ncbi:hypothetical protein [Nocardia rhizosphaerihabitans]|uniref:Uncharacterized protein n=1 Tax=Nocardia rhizosphaerihabitans TaxID=1691570 RepID=A0ABQ2K9I9_9NOCA|nr:hypothetical protein [Nocardia rhizosphaerihabitans]GGN73289.1 hypothetical protein GCM10011610_15570 [Nocardia rhizosphaerihabitans]
MIDVQQSSIPTTWRAADGSAVTFTEARSAWTRAAHEVLADTATRFNNFIVNTELAELVQEESGIRTQVKWQHWLPVVLDKVAEHCHKNNEPPLSALCVRKNQTVGTGYRYILELAGLPIPDDLEMHAAAARWQCYQHYATDLPADGGLPTLPPKVAALRQQTSQDLATAEAAEAATKPKRTAASTRSVTVPKPEPVRKPVCLNCHVELPANKICYYC